MHVSSHHQPLLVALSAAVAVFTAYVALDLAGRQRNAAGKGATTARWAWLGAAAVAMGGGIWSMHFIAMLALVTPVPVAYDLNITLVSLALPIVVTGGALALTARDGLAAGRLILGGLVMGGGIVLMHYVGMAAITMDGTITYDPGLVALSALIAVAAATAALRLAGAVRTPGQRALGAVTMGAAVIGMHYVGMAAATFTFHEGNAQPWFQATPVEPPVLALQVAGVTGVVLALALTSSTLARRSAERKAREAEARLAEEREHTETRLRQSEERLRLAVQATGLGTWDWDMSRDVILWSERTYALFGLAPGGVVDYAQFLRAVHPDDRAATEAAVRAALDPDGDGRLAAEFRALQPDGTVRWLSTQGQTHFENGDSNAAGRRPVRLLGTILDITARRLAEERLRASLQEKEMLLREVHHRVKNNMQAITAILQLEAAQVADEKAREGFAAVGQRIQAMARLHEQLYSAQDLRRIDLRSYFGDLGQGLAALHVGLPVRIESAVEALVCDLDTAMPLGLIANELVTNSLKHAFPDGRSGTVRIRLFREGDDVVFEVSDDGVGSDTGERAKGLGKRLIEALAQQVQAQLDINRAGGYRSCFRMPGNRFTAREAAGTPTETVG
ncbi:MHYT domain-containing protein [Azospirillum canadense]|uniref:MHYT domain-containing protein n=1 Tax=Azospirillum canadense TaxID=403962 RepID=UPI002225D3FC|nr:MHYT domain-containing protein [Azospirillum canadense]MCW2242689.1 PAS domain S-box-containing protein [Azospirillum canadense]